jgi:hypothetical protein
VAQQRSEFDRRPPPFEQHIKRAFAPVLRLGTVDGDDHPAQPGFGQPTRRGVAQNSAPLTHRPLTGNDQDTTPTGTLAPVEKAGQFIVGRRLGQAMEVDTTIDHQLTTSQPLVGAAIKTGTPAQFQRRQARPGWRLDRW